MTQTYDQFTDLLQARYSCRAFLSDPLPEETITQIVSAARHVPSWCNAQPWQVTVTRGAGTDAFRAALLEAASANPPVEPDLAAVMHRLASGLQGAPRSVRRPERMCETISRSDCLCASAK